LKLLNKNSRMSYRELARMSGMNEDTVRYRLSCLKKDKVITRFTIAVQNAPVGYSPSACFTNCRPIGTSAPKKKLGWLKKSTAAASTEAPLLDRLQLAAPVSGSFRSFEMSLLNDRKKESACASGCKDASGRNFPETRYASITETIKGLKPFRSLGTLSN
jgi:DNA-binding Lrp family transcriptional regulator